MARVAEYPSSHGQLMQGSPRPAAVAGGNLRGLVDHRQGGVVIAVVLFLATSALTRLAFTLREASQLSWDWTLAASWFIGLGYDLVTACVVAVPLAAYLAVVPEWLWRSRAHRWLMHLGGIAACYGLVVLAAAEWVFWMEFEGRFNFIAVDYLVYTEEVLGNIRESYPTGWIFSGLAVLGALLWAAVVSTGAVRSWLAASSSLRSRAAVALGLTIASAVAVGVVREDWIPDFANRYNRELAKDGVFSLFAAFQANHLEYQVYYTTRGREEVFTRLRELLPGGSPAAVALPAMVARRVTNGDVGERHLNVVQITVESLSASYMARFGNTQGITPNLDRLAGEGLLFTDFYATGTRTTRGMEALTLALPPTPGRSIIHREHNDSLFSLGSVLQSRGFDTAFLYGGYGYFDNMNAFFSSNGYRIVDRAAVPPDEVSFATIWGACDEDLYRWTLAEADRDHAAGKPFHFFVMTTSNHRPFTYPDGRIDIPSKSGRAGAVKYTDYAIGRFIEEARTRPWFADTIFVIVGDHCASSAGKAELTVPKYHIPMIFYAPSVVAPGEVDTLSSQVDYPPTLLALMGFDYDSLFFGQDILAMGPADERAFIGNYQALGLLTRDRLQVLRPNRDDHTYAVDLASGALAPVAADRALANDAVAFYQGAAILFTEGRYRAPAGDDAAGPTTVASMASAAAGGGRAPLRWASAAASGPARSWAVVK